MTKVIGTPVADLAALQFGVVDQGELIGRTEAAAGLIEAALADAARRRIVRSFFDKATFTISHVCAIRAPSSRVRQNLRYDPAPAPPCARPGRPWCPSGVRHVEADGGQPDNAIAGLGKSRPVTVRLIALGLEVHKL